MFMFLMTLVVQYRGRLDGKTAPALQEISYRQCDTGLFILKLFIDKVTMFSRHLFFFFFFKPSRFL